MHSTIVLSVLLVLIAGAVLYLFTWPISASPKRWDPPEAPGFTGPVEPNKALADADTILNNIGQGPEAVVFDDEGRLYTGFEDGRIVRSDSDGQHPTCWTNTGGRPLGMAFHPDGQLIVADAERGLLQITPDTQIKELVKRAEGRPFALTNDVDVSSDGRIYFTDSSDQFGHDEVLTDLLEHGGRGRFLQYDPSTEEVEVLLDGLQFANGVALSGDESYVLICETGSYRVRRYWLSGPKAGTNELFIDSLPGFPDNITRGSSGRYWLALPAPRNKRIDQLGNYPTLRSVLIRLPNALSPTPERYGLVLGLNENGTVVHNLQDPEGDVAFVASAIEHEDQLYLGTYQDPSVRVVPLPSEGG